MIVGRRRQFLNKEGGRKNIIEPKIILYKPKDLIHDFNIKVNIPKERINKQIQINIQCHAGGGRKKKI